MKINSDLIVDGTNYTLGDITTSGKHLLSQTIKTDKTWIDGKPIYRTVFSYDVSSESARSQSVNISSLQIDTCIYNNSFCKRWIPGGNEDFEKPYFQSETDYFRCFIRNKTNIEIRIKTTYSNIILYAIIEYTKTTD